MADSSNFYQSSYWLEESRKRSSLKPIIRNGTMCKPIPYASSTRHMLSCVEFWTRGFQRRNLRSLIRNMTSQRFGEDFMQNIIVSWCKFKLMAALNPRRKMEYVWMFKNLLLPEQQEGYKELRDCALEDPVTVVQSHIDSLGYNANFDSQRVFNYFVREPMELWLPLDVFPLVEVYSTSKLEYCFLDYTCTEEDKRFVRSKVSHYLYNLGVEELFIPPADVLFKVGNQRYNDNGVVRYDYEMPKMSFDSSFKLQKFLSQPLTPREVWLPGKAIKNNNNFMMNICRQLLKHDPVYPTPDLDKLWDSLKDIESGLKFDISAFGLQYLREYLEIGVQCIQELYPSSDLDEQGSIMIEILSRTSVQLEDNRFVYPKRGIGLGYYEDLKTIILLALLSDYKLYSVYGDQGLIPMESMEAIQRLQDYNFILKDEKIELFRTGVSQTFKWGGMRFGPNGYERPREFLDPLIGAFFSRYHWERKLALHGLSIAYPEVYRKFNKRITFMYETIFGYEFFKGDTFTSFENAGINIDAPIVNGHIKSWKSEHLKSPVTSTMFDVDYNTPFLPSRDRKVPTKVAKDFSKFRKITYKRSTPMDNSVYLYSNPRLRYNKKDMKVESRLLPVWADYLYFAKHGRTTGAITSGLCPDDILLAPLRQVYSDDPFRARATGGYKVLTHWRSPRGPSEEWVMAADILSNVSSRELAYTKRTDLRQNPSMMLDPLYYNDNLVNIIEKHEFSKKRKRANPPSVASNDTDIQRILEILPSKLAKNQVNNFADLISLSRDIIGNVQIEDNQSECGVSVGEDDQYYYELAEEFGEDIM